MRLQYSNIRSDKNGIVRGKKTKNDDQKIFEDFFFVLFYVIKRLLNFFPIRKQFSIFRILLYVTKIRMFSGIYEVTLKSETKSTKNEELKKRR